MNKDSELIIEVADELLQVLSIFNLSYKKAYLSRLKFGFNYTYLEHNELLDESEMQSLKYYGCEISMKYKELFGLNK